MAFIKKHKVLISLVLVVAIVAGVLAVWFTSTHLNASAAGPLYGTSEGAPVEDRKFQNSTEAPEGMKLAAETGDYALFVDELTAMFAVLDRNTNTMWYSNPVDQDESAIGDIANRLKSQITIEYYTATQQLNVMDSYFYSVFKENFEIEPIKNGFRTVYTIGKENFKKGMLPQILTPERFESYREKMTTEEYTEVIDRRYNKLIVSDLTPARQSLYVNEYPGMDINAEYYILDINTPTYEFAPIYNGFFDEAGYTDADLKSDNDAAGIETETFDVELATIPLEITLTETGFAANVPTGIATIPETFHIKELHLLEFFGCSGPEDEGYVFLPDGSGTIVNFNNGKLDPAMTSYGVNMYGYDNAILKNENTGKTVTGTLPVFAEKFNDNGFWAVIENGDAISNVISVTSGNLTKFNRVYPSFELQAVDFMIIKSNTDVITTNRYQEKPYNGALTVAYNFLETGNADYDDAAVAYRDYLIEKGELKQTEFSEMPFMLELVGRLQVEKNVLGLSYDSYEVLTSFDEAATIVNKLSEAGVKAPTVKYTSWFSGTQDTMTKSSGFASGMGGEEGYNNLKSAIEGINGQLYLNTTVQNAHMGLLKFNNILYGSRYTFNETIALRPFHFAQIVRNDKESKYYLVSPRYMNDYLGDLTDRIKELSVSNMWLDDYANELNSDYSKNANVVRQESLRLMREALESNASDLNTAFDAPYSYMFKYASFASETPTTSSGHRLADATVPFYSIVISGSIPSSGQVINLAGNVQDEMLKAVETGSGLSFKWIYIDNTALREMDGSEPDKVYSLNYTEWIDTATEFYNKASKDLDGIWGKAIIGHSTLAENVYKTDWENASVIVNYNDVEVTVGEYTIPANDYLVVKGE